MGISQLREELRLWREAGKKEKTRRAPATERMEASYIISLYFQVSHTEGGGGGGGGVKGHFLPTEENIMYLKKERSILLGATDCAVGLGLRLFLSRSNRIETAWL